MWDVKFKASIDVVCQIKNDTTQDEHKQGNELFGVKDDRRSATMDGKSEKSEMIS